MKNAEVIILNEIDVQVNGLSREDAYECYDTFKIQEDGYRFSPLFALGKWDGYRRYFSKTGKTYFYFIEKVIRLLTDLGYKIKLVDKRKNDLVSLGPIDKNIFKDVKHLDTGEPIILRDEQVNVVNKLLEEGNGICLGATAMGKAQPYFAKVLTEHGWSRMGDLKIGDKVITPDNNLSHVVGIFEQGMKRYFKITFDDLSTTYATDDHLWELSNDFVVSTNNIISAILANICPTVPINIKKGFSVSIDRNLAKDSQFVFTDKLRATQTIARTSLGMPICAPIDVPSYSIDKRLKDISIYHLGAVFSGAVKKWYNKEFFNVNLDDSPFAEFKYFIGTTSLRLCEFTINEDNPKRFPYSIPMYIQELPLQERIKFVEGVLDTLKSESESAIKISVPDKILVKDMFRLFSSVGFKGNITHIDKNHQTGLFLYHCLIEKPSGDNGIYRYITKITLMNKTRCRCIAIDDPKHLYITDDYIVTHNTITCAALIRAYDNEPIKSLTIVPDQTLLTQTRNEYKNCMLDTGEYSKKRDLDHKHVVATWQALQYNPEIVRDFKILIVDECHKIAGKKLFELVTVYGKDIPYRFGFSGTLPKCKNRKTLVHIGVGDIKVEIPAKKLIDNGTLANLNISILQITEDLHQQYKTYLDQFSKNPRLALLTGLKSAPTYSEFKRTYFPDYAAEKAYLQKKTERLELISDIIIKRKNNVQGNVLCLVNSVKECKELQKRIPGSYIVNGTDVKKAADRRKIYDKFKDTNNLVVIATVHIAGTGLSINRIFNLFTIDIGKSFERVIQAIGRSLRKAEDKDYVDVYDICSDLKYSSRHMNIRIKYYKECEYPFTRKRLEYRLW